MDKIMRIFHAGFTCRWHTHPHLSSTQDRLDGHQGRVARLILALWPDAGRDLIISALTHDDGESITGDVPFLRGKVGAHEDEESDARRKIWGMETVVDDPRLKFADRLDAYLWAKHHAPHVQDSDGWPEARQWLEREAEALGVEDSLPPFATTSKGSA